MINSVAKKIIEIFNVNKFIETGIKEGDTLNIVTSWFSELYGDKFITETIKHGETIKTNYNIYEIDIDPIAIDNANRIKQKTENIINILGDSATELEKLIDSNTFNQDDSCFFYFDAHLAGVSEPLLKEIEQIKRLNFPVIFSIDDWYVKSLSDKGYSDFYKLETIKNHIIDYTDVIYETSLPNVHSKQSCFVFMGYNQNQLSRLLKKLPLIETKIK